MSNRNSRKSGKNRRPQASKSGENRAMMVAMQGKRTSSAAGVHSDKRDRRGARDNQWKSDF